MVLGAKDLGCGLGPMGDPNSILRTTIRENLLPRQLMFPTVSLAEVKYCHSVYRWQTRGLVFA